MGYLLEIATENLISKMNDFERAIGMVNGRCNYNFNTLLELKHFVNFKTSETIGSVKWL
jgi:hypothetical protein